MLSEPAVGGESEPAAEPAASLDGGPAAVGTALTVPGRASSTTVGSAGASAAGAASPAVQRQVAVPTSDPIVASAASPSPVAEPGGGSPTEPTGAGPTAGPVTETVDTVEPSVAAADPVPEPEYPPMIQRRIASSPAESADDQAPLSGFAAAITALQQEPDDVPSAAGDPPAPPTGDGAAGGAGGPDLVVARQVAEPSATGLPRAVADVPLVTAPLRARGTATPASAPTDLVVARRIAPDSSGSLPAADVRLPVPNPRRVLQRRLLADQPAPIGLPAPVPQATAAADVPQVQRIRYEDAHPAGRASMAAASAADLPPARGTTTSVVAQPAPSAGFSPPIDGSSPPVAFRAAVPSAEPAPPPAVQRLSVPDPARRWAAVTAAAGNPTPFTPSAEPVRPLPIEDAPHEPFVQRSTDPRASSTPTLTTFGASGLSPTAATSSRTVGLAEMFALAAEDTDGPAVQRSATGTTPAATEVQLAPADAPATSSAAPAASGAGAPGGAPGANDIEEMARRLYEPLSARLRAEFWQDRERAGLLTDLRP